MQNIVLASKSPRRRELFSFITDNFICCEVDIDETKYHSLDAKQQVLHLAEDKCKKAAEQYSDFVVVGCDTLVELDDMVLGKPKDRNDAFSMIKALAGYTHTVYTGVSIKIAKEIYTFSCKTDVTFNPMSEEEIREYVDSGESDDKAGAYGMQGYASRYIKSISGDYFNVIGLPISMIYRFLYDKKVI